MNDIHNNTIEICLGTGGYNALKESFLNKNEIICFSQDFVSGDISNIKQKLNIDSSKKVCIYSCKSNIHDYLSFIYLCTILNNNISVVFTDDYDKDAFGLSAISPREIPNILKYEKKLSEKDIEEYKKEWEKLVNENSELRIIKNKKVISVSYGYLDNYIKECIVENNIPKTVANMMLNDEENNFSDKICYDLLDKYMKK